MKILHRLGTVAFALIFTAAAASAAAPKVALHLQGLLFAKRDGKTVTLPIDRPLKAGDLLLYRIDAHNEGKAAALGLEPVGKVPTRTVFVRVANAPRGSHVEFTLDGTHWSAHPMIRVIGPNGKPTEKPAPLAMYRAVRWSLSTPLSAGATAVFAYEVRVK